MFPTRRLSVLCLSTALTAGALSLPAPAQTSQQMTLSDFQVQPTHYNLTPPFYAFPYLRFETRNGEVSLIEPGVGTATREETIILPSGIYTLHSKYTRLWSQPLGDEAVFTLKLGASDEEMSDSNGVTIWSLPYSSKIAVEENEVSIGTTYRLTLATANATLTIAKRVFTATGETRQLVGSEPVPALKLTIDIDKNVSDLPLRDSFWVQLLSGPYAPTAVPDVQIPPVAGTYYLTYQDAQGSFLREIVTTVWKPKTFDIRNTLRQPYEAIEYTQNERGKLTGSWGGRTYFLGIPEPQDKMPPVAPPSHAPGTFRLAHHATS